MTQDFSVAQGTLIADRYRIDGLIARGGMGAVHEATDVRLGRSVALKVLRAELTNDRTLIARFEREAKLAAQLAHPGIAQVLDFGATNQGLLYLVMERIPGETFGALLTREGRIAPRRSAELVEQALGALSAAHQAGIVHRDLKPGNMMVIATGESREVVKLLDFGIAHIKACEAYTRLTQTGVILGTPIYMAPEQARGEAVDARTDVYAMGIVLWCLLTCQKPFAGRDMGEIVEALLHAVPERADKVTPEVPSELAQIAERAMQKDPRARFQSAGEMARALVEFRNRVGSKEPASPRFEPPPPIVGPPRRRSWWGLGALALGLACFTGVALAVATVAKFVDIPVLAPAPAAEATGTQSLALEPDFTPNPTTLHVVGGGPVSAERMQNADAYCVGNVAEIPSIRLTTSTAIARVLVSTDAMEDTTLMLRLSDGRVLCDDDGGDAFGAGIRVDFPAGTHEIFVGAYVRQLEPLTAVSFALGGLEKEPPPPECIELVTCCEAANPGHSESCEMWRHPTSEQTATCAEFLEDCLRDARRPSRR